MALRADLYTAPTAATFEALEDDLNMVSGSGTVEWSGWTDCTIEIPRDQTILSGRLVGIYDGPTLIDEFLIETQKKTISREGDNTWTVSGPQINGLTQRIGVWPQDYPLKPSTVRDWIWNGQDIISNGGFENNALTPKVFDLEITATGGTFTLTDGGPPTSAIDWDAISATIETRMEADLGGYTDVVVAQISSSPVTHRILMVTPGFGQTLAVNVGSLTGGTAEISVVEEGGLTATPWTNAQVILTGAPQGTYDEFGPRTAVVRTGTYSLLVDPGAIGVSSNRGAGAQQVVTVIPGETYQVSAWINPTFTADKFRLGLFTLGEEVIEWDDADGASYTAGVWAELTLVDVVIPVGVTQAILRIQNTNVFPVNPSIFYIDDVTMTEGFVAATPGEIIRLLLEAAQARLTGLWLDLDFSDTVDTLSTSWGAGIAFRAFPPQTLAHVLEALHQLGVNWHITRKATPSGALTHDLHVYAKDSAPDLSSTVEILSPHKGELVDRLPQATSRLGLGAGGLWDELVDTAAATEFGRWEGQYEAEHLLSEAEIATFLSDIEDEEQINRLAFFTTLTQNDPYVPLKDFRPGDNIGWQFPAIQTTVTRPVKTISWQQGETAKYQVTGSKVYDDETGLARAVEFLLDEIKPRTRTQPQGPASLPVGVGGGTVGAFVHLTRAATQSIAVGGEAISWDTISALGQVEFTTTVPTTVITIERAGYYNIAVLAGWSSWTDGGIISVVRTRGLAVTTVWPPTDDPGVWTGSAGDLFEGTAHAIQCQVADTLEVLIDAGDSSAQTLVSAGLAVYMVDRADLQVTYEELVLSHGPIAYWRLDETTGTNAADRIGSFDATYTSSPTLNQTGVMLDGSASPSVDFTVGPYVLGQDWTALDFPTGEPHTIEAWFHADAWGPGGGENGVIIEKRGTAGGNGWNMVVTSAGVLTHLLDGGSTVSVTSSVSLNTTYHAVATNDGTTLRLYVNGEEVDSTGQLDLVASGVVLAIGRDHDLTGEWDGRLDEVAIYDRALTASEIRDHYTVGTRNV